MNAIASRRCSAFVTTLRFSGAFTYRPEAPNTATSRIGASVNKPTLLIVLCIALSLGRTCQHPHQFAGANASHDFCSSRAACPGLLLWWRSGGGDVAVCSGKDCSGCGTDAASCLLRWRSGRRHVAVCSGQDVARTLSDRLAESAGVLRRRSGRRHLAVCSIDGRHPEPVTLAYRLNLTGRRPMTGLPLPVVVGSSGSRSSPLKLPVWRAALAQGLAQPRGVHRVHRLLRLAFDAVVLRWPGL